MKKILVLLIFTMVGFTVQSQETSKKKNAKIYMEVDGVCGMCKKRIESAALKTKGVKYAVWDVKTHQLSLIIDENKTNKKIVQEKILYVGHDIILSKNKKLEAALKAYESVNPCCKYRDKDVVESHSKM